ncbi:MAG TPA: hypothetical protein VIM15_13915 [Gemmatimonadaceae bacterium]
MTVRPSTVALALLASVVLAACARDQKSSAQDDDDDDDSARSAAASPSTAAAQPADSSHLVTAPRSTAGAAAPAPQGAPGAPTQTGTTTWTFDSSQVGSPPSGFSFGRTGKGRLGTWVVRAAPDAPSAPNVLAQEDNDNTDYRFPVAVADAPSFRDVSVSVRCKPVSGRVDQACGIVWRYQDENNYYLTRANALEDNVCWYYVQNGRRVEVKRVHVRVASGVWHSLRADMRSDHVEVYFNDKKLIDVHDSRFTAPGRVGVWTKADSRTLFDNLTATNLGS